MNEKVARFRAYVTNLLMEEGATRDSVIRDAHEFANSLGWGPCETDIQLNRCLVEIVLAQED